MKRIKLLLYSQIAQRGIAATNQRRKSLDHELHELHEYTLLSVIPAKAGNHSQAKSCVCRDEPCVRPTWNVWHLGEQKVRLYMQ
jgi:hypothetical protein